MRSAIRFALIFYVSIVSMSIGQSKKSDIWSDDNFSGLKFRSIGPAFMSGRISDIAIHPEDENIWYLAVGSGNVWKTENAGITWTPIFDDQGSYSIGCVTIDPKNPNVVWVGTGEDLGGRHFGYGDGIYKSDDGGQTWTNMGLKDSEHISKIVIHPNDSNTIWVASQGPLWSSGGERGVYKTTDGGKNWNLAKIQGPVLPICHTRFRFPWRWDGNPAVLQSRCQDETGYIQPTIKQLVDVRGLDGHAKFASVYHLNGIQSWSINKKGEVKNVHYY